MVETDVQSLTRDAWDYLEGRGLEVETIVEAQFGYVPEGRFANSISIPYFDGQGRHRSTRYRRLDPNVTRKYDQEKGTKQHLYGIEDVNEPVVYICEGEFDRWILKQLGYAAVGIAGVTNFARPWRFLFRNSDLVLVVMDDDEAGRKAGMRIASQLSMVTNADIIELPGCDVTDLYLKDPEHLRSLCELPS